MLPFPGHQRASSCQTQWSIFLLMLPGLRLKQRLTPSSWKRFLPPGLQELHSPGFATSLATILNYFVGSPHLLSHPGDNSVPWPLLPLPVLPWCSMQYHGFNWKYSQADVSSPDFSLNSTLACPPITYWTSWLGYWIGISRCPKLSS